MRRSLGLVFLFFMTTLVFGQMLLPNLVASTLKYEPYPAEPGKYLKLWISVENQGLKPAERVEFQLVPIYPFYLDEGENATRYFPVINAKESVLLEYKVRVASDAVEGWNELKLRYRLGDYLAWIEMPISVYVRTRKLILEVENIEFFPFMPQPGDQLNLSIKLRNAGDSDIHHVVATLITKDSPLVPWRSASEREISLLRKNESITLTFPLLVLPSARTTVAKLPFTLTYQDSSGNTYTKSETIAVKIVARPEIEVYLLESSLTSTTRSGRVSIDLCNSGLGDAQFLRVTVLENEDFSITSSNKFYIGGLSSDDCEAVELEISLKRPTKIVTIPLELEYYDEDNIRYTKSMAIDVKIPERPVKWKIEWILLLILLLLLPFFLKFRRRKS